jgi:hypothetical protein
MHESGEHLERMKMNPSRRPEVKWQWQMIVAVAEALKHDVVSTCRRASLIQSVFSF